MPSPRRRTEISVAARSATHGGSRRDRDGSLDAIVDANMQVDRCLRAGAIAMGAEVEINTIPGYLPQRNDRQMGELFGGNVTALFGAGSFDIGGHRTGSTDMGDIAHMKPVIHPYVASALGKTHGADFRLTNQSTLI
jgi:metal-dependent amidase/aminoacylase/carboxypeptidase family protein